MARHTASLTSNATMTGSSKQQVGAIARHCTSSIGLLGPLVGSSVNARQG